MRIEGSNGFDPETLQRYLTPIDEADDELASLLGTYREGCIGPRARIKNAKAMAKKDGVNPTAFNELIATRRAERAKQRRLDAMEYDDRGDYEAMVAALGEFGDTALGAAALAAAKAKGEQALAGLGDGPPPGRADAEALSQVGRG